MPSPEPPPLKRAFPPIIGQQPRLLILGSMPGEGSLRAGEYYGHRRNAFWPILCALLGVPADAPYPVRTAALLAHGIALWDVIAACARPGSLDSAIRPGSVQVNDFGALFGAHPTLRRVAFNGGTAEREYRRRVLPALDAPARDLTLLRLPSTSPAHAGMPYAAKRAAWGRLLGPL